MTPTCTFFLFSYINHARLGLPRADDVRSNFLQVYLEFYNPKRNSDFKVIIFLFYRFIIIFSKFFKKVQKQMKNNGFQVTDSTFNNCYLVTQTSKNYSTNYASFHSTSGIFLRFLENRKILDPTSG